MIGGVLAIIPARGGSKGIPRKNLRVVGGVSLLARAVFTGLESRRVDRVVVCTDDEEIAAAGRDAGAEVLMRPPALAADDTPTLPVLQFVVERIEQEGWVVDRVVLLEPTSPFRTPAVVDACIEKLDDPHIQSAATVTQLERNPYNIFAVEGDHAQRFVREPAGAFTRRQQFAHLKRINGCVYVVRSTVLKAGGLLAEPLRVVEMPAEASINIDTPVDLALAELMATGHAGVPR